MAVSTWDQIADACWAAGFRGEALATIVAIAEPESRRNPASIGDVSLAGRPTADGRTWGPSIGWFQIRTIVQERGTGRSRDLDRLQESTLFQARSAYEISGGGGNFRPWSTFVAGSHRPYLAEARAAAARRAAAGGTGAIGADALSAAGAGSDASPSTVAPVITGDIITGGIAVVPNYVPPRGFDELIFEGGGAARDLVDVATGGRVNLTADEVAQVDLEVVDVGLALTSSGYFSLRRAFTWRGLDMSIAAVERGTGADGLPEVRITGRERGAQRLKRTNVDAVGKAIGDVPFAFGASASGVRIIEAAGLSPTEWAAAQAAAAGLRFHGKGTARRSDIAPTKSQEGIYESPWAMLQRLADEEGFLAFASAGVLYFAPPSWLAENAPAVIAVKVSASPGLGEVLGDDYAIGIPQVRESTDNLDGAELEVLLPRWRGEQVRPGMALTVQGLATGHSGRWLIREVSWPVDGGEDYVTVAARVPLDPPAKPAAGTPGSGSTNAAGSSPAGMTQAGSASALDFVDRCLAQLGDRYVFGAEARRDDANPSQFDCSELVEWAAAQVGITFPDGAYNQWKAATRITVEQAARTRGALLFVGDGTGTGRDAITHVAVSLGDGLHTIEARNARVGVIQGNISDMGWTFAGLIPGMSYGAGGRGGRSSGVGASASW